MAQIALRAEELEKNKHAIRLDMPTGEDVNIGKLRQLKVHEGRH
jgi:hypothetical protein